MLFVSDGPVTWASHFCHRVAETAYHGTSNKVRFDADFQQTLRFCFHCSSHLIQRRIYDLNG
jgi:hypothetical protein